MRACARIVQSDGIQSLHGGRDSTECIHGCVVRGGILGSFYHSDRHLGCENEAPSVLPVLHLLLLLCEVVSDVEGRKVRIIQHEKD